MSELDVFLKELTAYYVGAAIAPGLQFAWLADKQQYYVAVHIFPSGVASRKVVAKAVEDRLDAAILTAKYTWQGIIKAEEEGRAQNRKNAV